MLLFAAAPISAQSHFDDANAVVATQDYMRTGKARVLQTGAYMMFPYGHGQPTLRCAPLRVCTIELEPGERVLDDVAGDRTRWAIDFAEGPKEAPLVIVKPLGCDYTTNLMVSTDRRVYHFTLDAAPCKGADEGENPDLPYTRYVKFYYPDDFVRRHPRQPAEGGANTTLATMAGGRGGSVSAAANADTGMEVRDLADLHFKYRVQRDRGFPWKPLQVFDNGRTTCIRIPEEAYRRDLPVLYELDDRGEYAMINYVIRDGCYMVARVLDRMVLVIGDATGRPDRLLMVREKERER
jgi:type IV secretion system protein VirB9